MSLGMTEHGLLSYCKALLQGVSTHLVEKGVSSAVGLLFFCPLSTNKKIKIHTGFFNSTTKGGAGMRTPIKGQSTQNIRSITEPTENSILLTRLGTKDLCRHSVLYLGKTNEQCLSSLMHVS